MSDFESALLQIQKLVKDFKDNESKFLSASYQEAEVRNDFINKFFIALGWDVRHKFQTNPYEQEVKVEKIVQFGDRQRWADYAFFLTPNYKDVKFFVEAKKPAKNLYNADYYFQTCGYGWNAKTPVAVLTDFEEFHILDCRTRPEIGNILDNQIAYFHYSDYADKEKFSRIYWLFSREAVADNSIDKYAAGLPKVRGKAKKGLHKAAVESVDESFLVELDEIRLSLAKAFKNNNPELNSDELTEMTQHTIDRLVFIRFLEDKQIEPDDYVSKFAASKKAWDDFVSASRMFDAKYNGIVFKKHKIDTKSFLEPDEKTFSLICSKLARNNSPYNFDLIPIHILGSIYERFLSNIVVSTDKRARIEEKPEVRKAGGVYYTPQYIVNYIVDNTVGKLIEGKTPKEISKMHFADISCGSGSFLITVFDRLLDYYKKWYQQNPKQAEKDGCHNVDGKWVLSLKQKQKILTNNIYGVDIDHQAVEVTQLSLYLKLLEDETTATAHETWVMFKEQLLPSLNKNIVCGNSLIGTDIFEGDLFSPHPQPLSLARRGWLQPGEVAEVDEMKLKPMNFEDTFPEIMNPSTGSGGGFDAIVGNPPYLKLTANNLDKNIFNYYVDHYESLSGGSSKNLFQLFIERALSLSAKTFSYIVPEALLTTSSNKKIRSLMLDNKWISNLILFDNFVFKDATIGSVVFVLEVKSNHIDKTIVSKLNPNGLIKSIKEITLQTKDEVWDTSSTDTHSNLLSKICRQSTLMKELVQMSKGMVVKNRSEHLRRKASKDDLPFLLGSSMNRYVLHNEFFTNYAELTIIGGTRDFDKQIKSPRLLIRRTGNILCCVLSNNKELVESTLYILTSGNINLKYLLGILNSKLLTFYLQQKLITNSQGFPQILMWQLEQLPIILQDSSNKKNIKLITLVDQMLESKKQLSTARTEGEKEYLESKCSSIDRQIDNLVYELYGLTEDEIKIVEGN